MSLLTPQLDAPSATVTFLNASAAITGGTYSDINQYDMLALQVVGASSWDGTLFALAHLGNSGNPKVVPAYSMNGFQLAEIQEDGLYHVPVGGFDQIRIRQDTYVAGNVTVKGKFCRANLPPRNGGPHLIKRKYQHSLAAGANADVLTFSPMCNYFSAHIRQDGASIGAMDIRYRVEQSDINGIGVNPEGPVQTNQALLSLGALDQRGYTDWIEAPTSRVILNVINNSGITILFDLMAHGSA